MFHAALLLFTGSSVGCALAPNIALFLAGRYFTHVMLAKLSQHVGSTPLYVYGHYDRDDIQAKRAEVQRSLPRSGATPLHSVT